jgi:hypothetical protein
MRGANIFMSLPSSLKIENQPVHRTEDKLQLNTSYVLRLACAKTGFELSMNGVKISDGHLTLDAALSRELVKRSSMGS